MRTQLRWSVMVTVGLCFLGAWLAWGRSRVGDAAPPRPDAAIGTVKVGLDAGRNAESDAQFVVHEWGTFTNFSGSDGVQLDFRPLVDDDLPDFVFDRFLQSQSPLGKWIITARQRMETPVTYFYTDRPRDVRVRVDFPGGLLTEFFPPAKEIGPAFQFGEPTPLADSFIDWGQFRVLPESMLADIQHENWLGEIVPAAVPAVTGDNHYAYARETDSAIVEAVSPFRTTHYEKFLFYRGIGNFQLPLKFTALGGGKFEVVNSGPDVVPSLFLVHIEPGAADRVRYAYLPALDAQGAAYLQEPATDSSVDRLADAMVHALVAEGLYEKEARAMVKTWRSSWFGEAGTRLLYLVPTRLTEEVLPITIEPRPDELVRVLVGRMETLTPEEGDRLAASIRHMGTCVTTQAEPLRSDLNRLGRFAEPALEFLSRSGLDENGRGQVESLLAELRRGR